MSHIRTQIDKLFLNDKLGDLFSNSDGGQGMIDTEIERCFTFQEIMDILPVLTQDRFLKFLKNHDDHYNLKQFFYRLEKKAGHVLSEYQSAISRKRVMEILNNDQLKIKNRFPSLLLEDARKEFAKLYVLKHREIRSNTFEQVSDFFENPVAWI